MPRKRWSFVTTVEPQEPHVAPGAPSFEALVQATLIDFDELAQLPTSVKDQLVRAFIESIRRARAGLSFRKRGVSDQYQTKVVFVADLANALKAAGLDPTRWRKTYDGGSEDHEFPSFSTFSCSCSRRWAGASGRHEGSRSGEHAVVEVIQIIVGARTEKKGRFPAPQSSREMSVIDLLVALSTRNQHGQKYTHPPPN